MDNFRGIHVCLGLSDLVGLWSSLVVLMRVEVVWPLEALVGFFMSPMFMLGIWHGVD